MDLAEALLEGGDLARVDALLCAAERDQDAAMYAALPRLHWMTLAQPADAVHKIEAVLPQTLERLAKAGDEHGLAKAHLASYWAKTQAAAQTAEAGEHALLAAAHARKAGDHGLRARALAMYVTALVWGPADAETIASELDAIDTDDAPYLEALISIVRGEVQRLDGEFNECRGLMQSGIEQLQTMGIHTIPAAAQSYLAWAELYGGPPRARCPGCCERTPPLRDSASEGSDRQSRRPWQGSTNG